MSIRQNPDRKSGTYLNAQRADDLHNRADHAQSTAAAADQKQDHTGKSRGACFRPGCKKPVAQTGQQARTLPRLLFSVLKSPCPDTVERDSDDVVNRRMAALVAWSAEYHVSLIRTQFISKQGRVYERDLGPTTALQARRVSRFNPGWMWRGVVPE